MVSRITQVYRSPVVLLSYSPALRWASKLWGSSATATVFFQFLPPWVNVFLYGASSVIPSLRHHFPEVPLSPSSSLEIPKCVLTPAPPTPAPPPQDTECQQEDVSSLPSSQVWGSADLTYSKSHTHSPASSLTHSICTEQVNLENDLQNQSHQYDEVVGKLRHQQPRGWVWSPRL